MSGTYSNPRPQGDSAPATGRSGRSPVLQRAGREPRDAGDAQASLSDDYVGDGLVLRDGRIHVAPARDPGDLAFAAKATDSEKIQALLQHINTLRRELADAKLLGR